MHSQNYSNNPSFLIVKMSAIGDILQAFYVARYLKASYPTCHITWIVEERFHTLAASSADIDEVLFINMKLLKEAPLTFLQVLKKFKQHLQRRVYDVVFDLQGNCKSALITMLAKSKVKIGFGRKSVAEWPNLLSTNIHINTQEGQPATLGYLELVYKGLPSSLPIETAFHSPYYLRYNSHEILQDPLWKQPSIKIMLCPGSHWKNKQLDEQVFVKIVQRMQQQYSVSTVVIWGNEKEKASAQRLVSNFTGEHRIFGQLPWGIWQQIMLKMKCVISVDSCALHLAALVQVPTLGIFGPSSMQVYNPLGKRHLALQGQCPYGERFIKRCSKLRTCATGDCMNGFSVEELFLICDNILKSSR